MSDKVFNDIFKFHKELVKKFGKELNISQIYVSKSDFKKLEKSLKSEIKKQLPWATAKKRNETFHWEALNLMPNEFLADTVKEGYVVVGLES